MCCRWCRLNQRCFCGFPRNPAIFSAYLLLFLNCSSSFFSSYLQRPSEQQMEKRGPRLRLGNSGPRFSHVRSPPENLGPLAVSEASASDEMNLCGISQLVWHLLSQSCFVELLFFKCSRLKYFFFFIINLLSCSVESSQQRSSCLNQCFSVKTGTLDLAVGFLVFKASDFRAFKLEMTSSTLVTRLTTHAAAPNACDSIRCMWWRLRREQRRSEGRDDLLAGRVGLLKVAKVF